MSTRRPPKPTRPPANWSRYLPAVVAVVLALPCLSMRFLWDDFDFVQRAAELSLRSLAPDPSVVFYRPLSRTLFFWPIAQLGPSGWFWAHVVALSLLAAVIVMTQRIATRLYGARAGFYAGLCFAGLGALPMLVGWASATQDLLAILFVLLALDAQLAGRWLAAAAWMACGVLSKETAIALMPFVASARWFAGLEPSLLRRSSLAHAALAAGWFAIHPGMRMLTSRGFTSGEGGYIGFDASEAWKSIGQNLLATLNLPLPGSAFHWPEWVTPYWIIVLALAAAAWRLGLVPPSAAQQAPVPKGSAVRKSAFALALALLPIFATALLVRNWNPYYACFAAPGMALLAGPLLARTRPEVGLAAVIAFTTLGVLWRGAIVDPTLTVERNYREGSRTLAHLEANLKLAIPKPAPGATIYVGCEAPERSGIPQHLYRFQAPRTWYGDPSLKVRTPDQRDEKTGPEYLVWVPDTLTVVRLDREGAVVGQLPAGVDPGGAQRTARRYAIGFSQLGEYERAAKVLLDIPYPADYPEDFNKRIAGALLDAGGRQSEAAALRDGVRRLDRNTAGMLAIAALLEMPIGGGGYVASVLTAFDVAPDDEELLRGLMRWFAARNYLSMASSIGDIVLRLRPGDEEALAVEKRFQAQPRKEQIVAPTEGVARPG